MKNNIFEGAKFGDKFLTRDGQQCIIIEPLYKINDIYRIDYIVKGESEVVSCDINGNVTDVDSDWDIVSRYQEPIDEEKLDEFASEHIYKTNYFTNQDSSLIPHYAELCYKAGYRKAKEG